MTSSRELLCLTRGATAKFRTRRARHLDRPAAERDDGLDMVERRPGLAKVRGIPLTGRRSIELVSLAPPHTLEWIQNADVISEGAERDERGQRHYYGSSSLVLRLPEMGAGDLASMLRTLAADPHVRLHALRVARAEATSRTSGPVETMRADISLHPTAGGLEIVIDVSARVARAVRARI
jgi:hypothetical protein